MPQIDNTSEKVQNMLKANGIVEELQSDVTKLQSDVGDRSGHNLNLTEQVDVIHRRQDGYVSGSVAVPRAKKAEQDGEGNNIVGTYVDNNRFIELSNDLYQLFDSTTPMGDRRVKAATRDALGNEIHTTYSTKQDLLHAEGIIQEFQIEDEIIQIRDSERIKDIQPGVKYLNQASTGKRGVIVVPAPNDTQFFFDPDGNVYKRIKKEARWTEWQPIGNGGDTNITVDAILDSKSINPVQNKVISDYLDALNYYGNMDFRPSSDSHFKFSGGSVESYNGSALMEVIVPYYYYGDSMMFIVNTIGTSAFQGEGLVESIVLPNTIEVIESLAFAECSILEKIRLPNCLSGLPDQVFFGCKNLTSITLPNSIVNIGAKAFDGSALTDIYYEGTKEQWALIDIAEDNETLLNATVHFNWVATETYATKEEIGKLISQVECDSNSDFENNETLANLKTPGIYKLIIDGLPDVAWLIVGNCNSPDKDCTQTLINSTGEILSRYDYLVEQDDDGKYLMAWTEWQPVGKGGNSEIIVDTELNSGSTNPVQNKAIVSGLDALRDEIIEGVEIGERAIREEVARTYATKDELNGIITSGIPVISFDDVDSAPVGFYKVSYGDNLTYGYAAVCGDGAQLYRLQILPDGTIYRRDTTNQYATYDESTGELDSYIVAQKAIADKNGNIIDETYATKEELSIKNLGFIDESSLDNLLEPGVYLYSFEKIEFNSRDTLYEILINEDLQSSAHNFITQRKLLSKERRSREYFVTEGIINHWNDWTSWEIDEDKVLLNWTSDVKLGYSSVPNANLAEHSVHDALGNIIHDTYATKQEIGDIETALDGIIAIQNSLLGVNE